MTKAQASVQLFLVPGMQHCSGGVGPDQFDTLSALEAWVEHGKAPGAIAASTKPDAAVPRALPLCPYPQQARYSGSGAVGDVASWKGAAPGHDAPVWAAKHDPQEVKELKPQMHTDAHRSKLTPCTIRL